MNLPNLNQTIAEMESLTDIPFEIPNEKENIEHNMTKSAKEQADELRFEGNIFFKKGEFQKAIDKYTKGIEKYPNEKLYYNKGIASYKLQYYDWAIENTTAAIKMDSKHYKAYFCRGMSLLDIGEWKMAKQDLTSAYELSSSSEVKKKMDDLDNVMKKKENYAKGHAGDLSMHFKDPPNFPVNEPVFIGGVGSLQRKDKRYRATVEGLRSVSIAHKMPERNTFFAGIPRDLPVGDAYPDNLFFLPGEQWNFNHPEAQRFIPHAGRDLTVDLWEIILVAAFNTASQVTFALSDHSYKSYFPFPALGSKWAPSRIRFMMELCPETAKLGILDSCYSRDLVLTANSPTPLQSALLVYTSALGQTTKSCKFLPVGESVTVLADCAPRDYLPRIWEANCRVSTESLFSACAAYDLYSCGCEGYAPFKASPILRWFGLGDTQGALVPRGKGIVEDQFYGKFVPGAVAVDAATGIPRTLSPEQLLKKKTIYGNSCGNESGQGGGDVGLGVGDEDVKGEHMNEAELEEAVTQFCSRLEVAKSAKSLHLGKLNSMEVCDVMNEFLDRLSIPVEWCGKLDVVLEALNQFEAEDVRDLLKQCFQMEEVGEGS